MRIHAVEVEIWRPTDSEFAVSSFGRVLHRYQVAELWKPVVGAPAYSVSSFGRVRGARGGIMRGQNITSRYSEQKYLQVRIGKVCKSVHRLVAAAFLGPSEHQINHKDLNKHNNGIWNLEKTTGKQNVQHYMNLKRLVLTDDEVRQIRTLHPGMTHREIAAKFGVSCTTVSAVLNYQRRFANVK